MTRDRLHFLLLNIGHFFDHLFMLIFATVAALALYREWGITYAELLAYATPGFFAFGLFSLPAGWLADHWSRDGMMFIFFVGIGLAAIATGFAQTPFQIGTGLFTIGVLAAIYHPVGLAIVTTKWPTTGMRIAVNGVWGNLGVASAALITGFLIDYSTWRMAFILPGVISIVLGVAYAALQWRELGKHHSVQLKPGGSVSGPGPDYRAHFVKIVVIVFSTTALGSLIFQSTTFALPKIFDERLQGVALQLTRWFETAPLDGSATGSIIGSLAFLVFSIASIAQLIVGRMLDHYGPRRVFVAVAAIQCVFFVLMPGLTDWAALVVALGFMLGAFGQIPINDFMIGQAAQGAYRARIYGIRFVISFTVLASSLPLIALVYQNWGFDLLFRILAIAAAVIFLIVLMLPNQRR